MDPKEVLRNGADVIEHVGHSQRYYEEREDTTAYLETKDATSPAPCGPVTGFCVYGAMTLAATRGRTAGFGECRGDVLLGWESRVLADVLELSVDRGDYFTAVTKWNDTHDGPTVAAGMRAAAAKLEEDERNA